MPQDISVLVVVRLPDKSKRNVTITINDGQSGLDLMDKVRSAIGVAPETAMRLLVGGAPVNDPSLGLKEGLHVVDGAKLMASVAASVAPSAGAASTSAVPAPLPTASAEATPPPTASAVPAGEAPADSPAAPKEAPEAGATLDADVYGAVHALGGDGLVLQVARAGVTTAAALLALLKGDPSSFGLSTPMRAKLLNALKKMTTASSSANPMPAPAPNTQNDEAQRRREAAEKARQEQLKAQLVTKTQNLSHGEASARQLLQSTEQTEWNNIIARHLSEVPMPGTAGNRPAADTNWIEVEIDGSAHTLPVHLDVATAETVRQFVRSKKGASMVVTLTTVDGSGLKEGPLRQSVRYGDRVRAVANLPGGSLPQCVSL